jgi:hypothetical protein
MARSVLRMYVARTLGAEPPVAEALLARVRAHHGSRFPAFAALFVLVTARPLALLVPRSQRVRFVNRFTAPMLDTAPAGLAYVTGDARHLGDPCDGMLRP